MSRFLRSAAFLSACVLATGSPVFAGPPVAGPNVNMVSGTRFPEGDPFLTKQNEPSLAVSSRNPRHLLAGSNDYRIVPVEIAEQLDEPEAWLTLYKSVDGGTSWRSVLLGGCPLNIPQCNDPTGLTAPLRALSPNFGADPTVRPGPYGTFFVSFIAGTRDTGANGAVAVQRFVDKNDDIQRELDVRTLNGQDQIKPAQDPILPDKLNLIDTGVQGQFKDKPWNASDVPGRPWNVGQTCQLLGWTNNPPAGVGVTPAAETVKAFSVYVSYANFAGQGQNQHPGVFVAASNDCGNTFAKPVKVSNSLQASQGTVLAVNPLNGTVYVAWRVFATSSSPDAIYMSKSTDGGKTWLNQPVLVAVINPYDQDAAGGAFRTLGFPTMAVSVGADGNRRVHIAWTQRKTMPSTVPPFACPATNPADCDARIVMSTSTDGGVTWPPPVAVDSKPLGVTITQADGSTSTHFRGHQVQPALTFSAGKLLMTWLDQRYDQTEEVISCPNGAAGACTSRREAKGNLVANCSVDVSGPAFASIPTSPIDYKSALAQCRAPYMSQASDAVWTTFMTDGTPGLVRRHTIDVFAAMADPVDTPAFQSNKVSRYAFGTTYQSPQDPNYNNIRDIRQKEVNAPNLPMFANGTAAFLGDYIDAAGIPIVATGNDSTQPYKFDIGCNPNAPNANCPNAFVTGGNSPVFHAAFTDNRDVVPPINGDWSAKTCLSVEFTNDVTGMPNGVTNFGVSCNFAGYAGNRNQNVYTAVLAENSVTYANANSKYVGTGDPRGFVVTVENLSDASANYQLTANGLSGVQLAFDKQAVSAATAGSAAGPLTVTVQPHSSSTRTVWVKSNTDGDTRPITVSISGSNGYASNVILNPDPFAPHVGNGDGTGLDVANNDVGNVVLTNAVLTNAVLTNAVPDDPTLNTNVLSNNALTNAALSNVALTNAVLTNNALSNLQIENLTPTSAALTNNALTNVVLSNVVLSNAVLSNTAIVNAALSNAVLSNAALSNVVLTNQTITDVTNAVLSNNALTNVALTNIDPANVALSNAVLSNNALTNVALSNAALSNVVLTNAALTNAALSNVALSNAALSNAVLSNAVLSNNVLSNAALSNAPLTGADGVPGALAAVEQANFDLSQNTFAPGDLTANKNFAEASFTVRNRGNTDTTLAIKLLLRDAATCSGFVCSLPDDLKLQVVLRKVSLTPAAIAPTDRALNVPYDPTRPNAVDANGRPLNGRALRLGLEQTNAQVSNVGSPMIVDPSDPNLGRFPTDPNDVNARGLPTLPLAPGERAYVTIRAIGKQGGTYDFGKLVDALRWGVKSVVVDANNNTNTRIPLIVKTLSLPAVTAGQAASVTIATFGGLLKTVNNVPTTTVMFDPDNPPICADSAGNPSTDSACPPSFTTGTFADDGTGTQTSAAQLGFTPPIGGTFYVLVTVKDQSVPAQQDRQLLKVVVKLAQVTDLTVNTTDTRFPTNVELGAPFDLSVLLTQPSLITSSSNGPITFATDTGSITPPRPSSANVCTVNGTLLTPVGVGNCTFLVIQGATVTYASVTIVSPTVSIVKAATTTGLTSSANPSVVGQSVTLTATVSRTSAGTGTPTGNVVFSEGATVLGTVGLSAGSASLTLSGGFALGVHNLKATYGGDGSFAGSNGTMSQTVGQASTSTTLAASANPTVGQGVTLSATVSATAPGAGTPTGSVTFYDGAMSLGVVGLTGSSGTLSVSLTGGNHSLSAVYGGDANFKTSTGSLNNLNVGKASSTTTLAPAAPVSVTYPQSVTLTPTVTGAASGPAPTGTLTFKDGATVLATNISLGTAYTANLGPGVHDALSAVYSGDGNYLSSTGTAATVTVNQASTTTTLTADKYVAGYGTPINLTGTVTPSAATGTVTFLDGAMSLGSSNVPGCNPLQPGNACFQAGATTPLAVGTHSLTAKYSGGTGSNYADSPPSAAITVTIQPVFTATGSMAQSRSFHTATLLYSADPRWASFTSDGRVLVSGGFDQTGSPTATSEVYCPRSNTNASLCPASALGQFVTVGNLPSKSAAHTESLLLANPSLGKVLSTGGGNSSAELFTPIGNSWTSAGGFSSTRSYHTATRLLDGRILFAGGSGNSGSAINTTQVYNPATGAFSNGPNMAAARERHTATLLPNGKVLLVGGRQKSGSGYTVLNSAEVCDVSANLCQAVAAMDPNSSVNQRYSHTASLIVSGTTTKVLVVGGSNGASGAAGDVASYQIYDPVANSWTAATLVSVARREHSATVLTNGQVLIAGGQNSTGRLNSAALFDPATQTYSSVAAPMTAYRAQHTATLLPDGNVLIIGGIGGASPVGTASVGTAEIYGPAAP